MEKVEIKKKKHREDWDTVTKKISFDGSYRFRGAWWTLFWVYCGLCVAFLAFGIVVFAECFKYKTMSWDTLKGIGLGCGFAIILVFALFWITNNFMNSKMFVRPSYPEEAKKLIKKQAAWSNLFRACAAILCLICGLLFVVVGFMWDHDTIPQHVAYNTPKIIAGCDCLLFMILGSLAITGYCKMIIYKDKILNVLVPKTTTTQEAKK